MRKRKKTVYKVLTKEKLSTFFDCVDDFKFKTILMLAYGSGLRIGEIANLRVEDIDSKKMRIFVREGKENKVIGYKQKVVNAVKDCKTGTIGANKYVCDECGREEIVYNSCRNRHQPNCQTRKKLQWIESRKEEVLNINYHIVFTIPSEMYLITLYNQEMVYKILSQL